MITILEELIRDSRSLGAGSRKTYAAIIRMFVRDVGEAASSWTPQATERWIGVQAKRTSHQTANTYLAAVKWAAKRYAEMGHGPNFAAAVEDFHVETQVRPHSALSHADVDKLLATCLHAHINDRYKDRDLVILRLGLDLGLRRAEMAALRWADWHNGHWDSAIDPEHKTWAPGTLTITGKGKPGAARATKVTVPSAYVVDVALDVLRALTPEGRHRPQDPVLQRAIQPVGGKPTGLTPTGVWQIVKRRAAQAGITVTTHELRHTAGTDALAGGAAPWRVQKFLRHGSLATTLGTYAHDPALTGDAGTVGDLLTAFRAGKKAP